MGRIPIFEPEVAHPLRLFSTNNSAACIVIMTIGRGKEPSEGKYGISSWGESVDFFPLYAIE